MWCGGDYVYMCNGVVLQEEAEGLTGALVATLTQQGHKLVTQVHHTTHMPLPTQGSGSCESPRVLCLSGVCLRPALCYPAPLPPAPSTGTPTATPRTSTRFGRAHPSALCVYVCLGGVSAVVSRG